MKKILLCSPYYADKEHTTCGIANWTRNIMSKQTQNRDCVVKLIPFDRSVDLGEESGLIERLTFGIKDYLGLVLKTKKAISNEQFDIIQISTSVSLGLIRDYLISKLAFRKNVKLVLHFHFGRLPELLSSNNWESRLLRKVLSNTYASIVMDLSSYEALISNGYKNVYFLPNPLSDNVFNLAKSFKPTVTRHQDTILFVGHVTRAKGVYELIDACSQIPNINLKIVGKVLKDTKAELLALAEKKGNANWVDFIGEIPHDDVVKEMCTCSMFVLPTYTEGFPNVILEAMACGCPIISTDVGAIAEMLDINSNNCGLLIHPKSVEELKDSILSVMHDDKLKHRISINAQSRVEKMYTVNAIWIQLEDIWRKILV